MKNSFDIPIYTIYNYQYLDIPMYNPDITHKFGVESFGVYEEFLRYTHLYHI